jgi:hypothetical protein
MCRKVFYAKLCVKMEVSVIVKFGENEDESMRYGGFGGNLVKNILCKPFCVIVLVA